MLLCLQGVLGLSRRNFFFFLKMGDAPFFFFSNDPISREVMMSQERVDLSSQEGGNIPRTVNFTE